MQKISISKKTTVIKSLTVTAFIAALLLTVDATVLNAQEKKTISTSPNSIDLNAPIPLNPKIKTGKLPNGLTYFIMKNSKPEKRAEIQLVVRAGSVQEEDYQAGLAHFTEHMLFNGTKNFPKDSLVKFLESTGARFGNDVNAYTSFDVTHYTLTIPLEKPEMFDKGMLMLSDWAMRASFDPAEIEKERGVILEEKRLGKNAQSRVMDKHFPALFNGSKYADRLPIGEENIIKNAPQKAFLDFYNDFYRPDLAAVIIVGDVDEKEAMDLLTKHFSEYKYRGEGTPKPRTGTGVLTANKEQRSKEYIIPDNKEPLVSIAYDKELPYGSAALYIKHQEGDKHSYKSYRETLKGQLLAIMLNSRLQELTREAKPAFLGAGGGVGSFLAGIDVFSFMVIPNVGDFATGLNRGLAEVFRAEQHGFTPTELERAKEAITSSYESMFNEKDKTESASYARELAGYFQHQESAPGIEKEFELVKQWLPEITLAEVNKMIGEWITPQNVVFTVSLPEGGTDKPTEKDILDIYAKARAAKYDAYVDDLGDAKLMANLPKAGTVSSTKKLPNFDITEMTLSNGARVLLKPTDFKNDQILFSCWADGGISLYPAADYKLADAAIELVDAGGLGDFTSTKLSKLLQSKMISLRPYSSDYEQGMQGSLTPKDKEIFFQLLNMQFTQPRKDKDAFVSEITKMEELLKNRDRDPQNAFRDTINAVYGNYDARVMPLTVEQLKSFDIEKAFKIYQERFSDASNFTFLFVGAFKIEELKPLLEQYIASLPATKKAEKGKDLGIKMPTGIIEKVVKAGIEPKSTVRLAIRTENAAYNSEEILKTNVMREIANIRLREEVREEKGGVYGIGFQAYLNYFPRKNATAMVYFGCDPARVDELISTVKQVFDEMQTSVSADNLNKVKEILKNEFTKSTKENNYWLRTIQSYDETDRDLAYLNDYVKKIDAITTADVIATAKKYLDYKKSFIRVVQMPEDDE